MCAFAYPISSFCAYDGVKSVELDGASIFVASEHAAAVNSAADTTTADSLFMGTTFQNVGGTDRSFRRCILEAGFEKSSRTEKSHA